MKKAIFILLLVSTTLSSANDLKVLNENEDSDTAEIQLRGNGESCRLWFASTGDIDKGSCRYMVNSKGLKIYCTPRKKMCKTYDEIHTFVFAPPAHNDTTMDDKGYNGRYKQCLDNSGGVTSDIVACNRDELKFQDSLLNKNYKKAMRVLNRERRAELKKVQRLWIKYRDSKCDFLYGLTGGTMDLIIGGGCYVDMTTERAEELKSIAASQ